MDNADKGHHHLRQLLRRAVRVLGLLERREVACCDVTLAQCHALQEIDASPGLTVGELASRLGVDPSTASRVVDGLVRIGAVQRHPLEGDRRALSLTLTPAGREQLGSLELQAEADARRVWEAPPEGRRLQVVDALAVLLDALEAAGFMRANPSEPGKEGCERERVSE